MNIRANVPRICALKIQNGSNNVLLDNSQGDSRQVTYTRRPRLLDEELLDEEGKEISGNLPINFTSSQSSMVLSTTSNHSINRNEEIFSTNKTDSEKFNEIQGKDVVVSDVLPSERQTPVVIECESKVFKKSELISSEVDALDSILLRRQQLTRVAEWVQNSSNIALPSSPEQKSSDMLCDQKQINNLDYENNNSVECKQNYASLISQVYKDSIPCESSAQNCAPDQINGVLGSLPTGQSSSSNRCDELNREKLDLVQMEYNVKKFLLKQNEWSIMNRPLSVNSESSSERNEETIFVKPSYQRTETNL